MPTPSTRSLPPSAQDPILISMIRPYRGISPTIAVGCYIDPSAQLIGDVHLGPQSSLWMNAVVRGDTNRIRIGARTNIQDCAVLHGMRNLHPVLIGSGVSIGHNATVHGCTIEDNVLIGIGATILNGAVIGANSIIAAGAVVTERTVIPPNSLVTGIPGKILRATTPKDLALIETAASNYLDYIQAYLTEPTP
jgi:carbonic anhydrase/acetyltransferase-like protein (isoleucine patch superfamily)